MMILPVRDRRDGVRRRLSCTDVIRESEGLLDSVAHERPAGELGQSMSSSASGSRGAFGRQCMDDQRVGAIRFERSRHGVACRYAASRRAMRTAAGGCESWNAEYTGSGVSVAALSS